MHITLLWTGSELLYTHRRGGMLQPLIWPNNTNPYLASRVKYLQSLGNDFSHPEVSLLLGGLAGTQGGHSAELQNLNDCGHGALPAQATIFQAPVTSGTEQIYCHDSARPELPRRGAAEGMQCQRLRYACSPRGMPAYLQDVPRRAVQGVETCLH